MDIKPIKTEADYEAVLEEIERLWGAAYDSPEGDKLDVLATLVEAYEEKHYPIPPPDPIEAILHHMESQGLSRSDLAPYLGSCLRTMGDDAIDGRHGAGPDPGFGELAELGHPRSALHGCVDAIHY